MNNQVSDAPSQLLVMIGTIVYAGIACYTLSTIIDVITQPLDYLIDERPRVMAEHCTILAAATAGYVYMWYDWKRRQRLYQLAKSSAAAGPKIQAGVWPPPLDDPQAEISPSASPSPPQFSIYRGIVIFVSGVIAAIGIMCMATGGFAISSGVRAGWYGLALGLVLTAFFGLGAVNKWRQWKSSQRDYQEKCGR